MPAIRSSGREADEAVEKERTRMQVETASTAWLLTCTALVLLMAPGLALS